MKRNIVCLLLAALSIITLPLLFAQQDQNSQGPNPEVAALKKRISELESKLQTVENVEKMELAAKFAEAQAKLRNAEFGKFKNELRESNNEWLMAWSTWFLTIIGIFVAILIGISAVFWFWLRSRADQLIVDSVQKSLNGFKKAVEQVNILQGQIRILEKEHAASVLEDSVHLPDTRGQLYSEIVKALPDGGLLDLIADKTRGLDFRYKAAEVLFVRKNLKLVSPVLELLNSLVNSTINWDDSYDAEYRLRGLVNFLGQLYTQESHDGLTKFLNRLLTENPKHKDLFLIDTVLSLVHISAELNMRDSVSMLKSAMSHFEHPAQDDLRALAVYFDRLDESTGIKEILTEHVTRGMPDAENTCLELLQKHDPEFVEKWKAKKETTNTQTEESE